MKKKLLQDGQDCQKANMTQKSVRKRKKQKPHKKLGRKRKRRLFDETRVGHFLKYEAPTEYGFIIEVCGTSSPPPADFIETIGYASLNPLFRKQKFRKALIEYRKYGLYAGQPKKSCIDTELYYIHVRRNNIQKMRRTNKNVEC